MATRSVGTSRWGWFVVLFVLGTVCLFWVTTGLLPLLALRYPWILFSNAGDPERVKSVIQELGAYGDIFGLFSALVSALALVGVVYTLILQQKQIQQQERDQLAEDKMRLETAALNAATAVAHAYCILYAGDPKGQEAQALNAMLARTEGGKVDIQQTVGAKLRSGLKLLEDMQKKMQMEWEKSEPAAAQGKPR